MAPARIADSRSGLQIPRAITSLGTAAVQVAGRGGIPGSGAAAVVATLTVTAPQAGGHLTAWPSRAAKPGTSNLNFSRGLTVANTVIVALGPDGRIQLFNGSAGTLQVIVDVTGYTRAGSPSAAGAMQVLRTPQRLADSRIGLGITGPVLALKTAVLQAVPASAGHVALTVTVVNPQHNGYITAFPGDSIRPTTSSVQFQAGRTVATTVIVPVSDRGAVALFNGSSGSVHLVVDLIAVTVAGTPTAAGTLGAVTARIADSRLGLQIRGAQPAHGTMTVQAASPNSGVAAAVATVTVVNPQAGGYVTAWQSGAPRPPTSNLDFQARQTVANTIVVPLGPDGKLKLFNGSGGPVTVIVDITAYTLTGSDVHGAVWAWGSGTNGQLGNGNTATGSLTPVRVFGLGDVTAVAGGGLTGYALRSDGTVWSWGRGAFGQWGTGACCAIVSRVPLQIPGLSNVIAIAAASGTGYALRSDGTVWSWGDGHSGALGDGDDESYSTEPVNVIGLEKQHITAIAGGYSTGYALTSSGLVYAWGAGGMGQLGNNTRTNGLAGPVSDLRNVTAIGSAQGGSNGFAMIGHDTAWAWGDGTRGQLGDGGWESGVFSAVPVQVAGLTDMIAVAGARFTIYAVRADGTVMAWGQGHYGELGNNTTTQVSAPVKVTVPAGATAVAGGNLSGYALQGGKVWAWGLNDMGQLGNATTKNASLPTAVTGLNNVSGIAAGGVTGYAVTR